MKKLMIAACAIAMAVCANAATTKWSLQTTSGKAMYLPGSTTQVLSGTYTAYLFCSSTGDTDFSDVITQGDLLSNLRKGGDISAQGHLKTFDIVNGVIANEAFTLDDFASGKAVSAYLAVLADDKVYIAASLSKTSNQTSAQALTFNPQTASQKALNAFTVDYSAAGWYATKNVPEPTSAMLLLLGMAGLALRRRRA